MNTAMQSGQVIKNTGSTYTVVDLADHSVIECKIKGKIRLKEIKTTNPVAVGDIVSYENDPVSGGVITDIQPRRNYIIRRSSNLSKEAHIIAANIDQAFIVVTIDFPKTSFEFIDRFLVTAEAYKIPAVVVLNKIDLYTDPEQQQMQELLRMIYAVARYKVIEVSAEKNIGIDKLRAMLKDKVSLFTGNSGVGKSTLIRKLDPNLNPKTGEISEYHNRGKHTTTFSEMYPLTEGGYIIDTPGIKGFGIVDIENNEICRYFPDIFKFAPQCQFYNCTHTHEPNCAVKEAVEEGMISDSRYYSYLKLMDDGGKYRR